MTVAAIIAVVAAVIAVGAAAAAAMTFDRARKRTLSLEEELDRGKAHFAEVITAESIALADELERTLALARSNALSTLAAEERRITEERRRDVAEREREATSRLVGALTSAQRAVEQRFAAWGADLNSLQQSLSGELERIGQRQTQLVAGVESKIAAEAERLESSFDEHRGRLAKVRDDLEKATEEVATEHAAELETHSAERRRALHEVAERLRRRERELHEQIEHEHGEAIQRVAAQLQDVEHRQVEQVKRIVARESQHASEAAATQFDATIRSAREEAARRLGRELDLAVERFARDAESVLTERLDGEIRLLESRVHELTRRLDSLSARA